MWMPRPRILTAMSPLTCCGTSRAGDVFARCEREARNRRERLTLADKPDYSRFLLAHECCHHSLGHMDRFKDQLGQNGPQRFFFIAPQLKQMELEADCCAVKMLRSKNDASSIEAAEGAMPSFGSDQTGAHYPTGSERVENMTKCAAEN